MIDVPGQIGPYRLLGRLGFGGMCEVFRARCFGASGFEKTVAIKVLLPEYRQDAEYQRQFIREATIGARLSHRNLVEVHDFGVSDGVHYMRMGLVDGGDLGEYIDEPMPVGLALYVASEVLLGLDYLHRFCDERGRTLGLVHRDVSPSNVLVSRHGGVRLGDFGILKATALADITRANVRKGKYAYMSPEQLAGERLGPRSDLFAAAVLLARLVSGRHPFEADDLLETLEHIEHARDPDLDDVPETLRPTIARCLLREPDARPTDAAELFAELTSIYRTLAEPGDALALSRWLGRA